MKKKIEEKIEVPEGVTVSFQEGIITVKGPKGELQRTFSDPWMLVRIEGNSIMITVDKATKREKTLLYTYIHHIKNMLTGVVEPKVYTLKICAGHFPMNVTLSGKIFSVKNFLGEKTPRTLDIPEGVQVKVEGDLITVESINIELAGQTAGRLERLTRITNRDLRIFQDGIYILEKPK